MMSQHNHDGCFPQQSTEPQQASCQQKQNPALTLQGIIGGEVTGTGQHSTSTEQHNILTWLTDMQQQMRINLAHSYLQPISLDPPFDETPSELSDHAANSPPILDSCGNRDDHVGVHEPSYGNNIRDAKNWNPKLQTLAQEANVMPRKISPGGMCIYFHCNINGLSSNKSSFSFPVTKSRRRRTEFTDNQIAKLEGVFVVNSNPTKATREQLAQYLHLQEDAINVWFKNRRAKQRRQSNATQ